MLSQSNITLYHKMTIVREWVRRTVSWLWSQIQPKNHVSLEGGINSYSFDLFLEKNINNSAENWQKFEVYQKITKYQWNFQNLQFLSYFNMQYLKREHFYHRIQFHTEKVWFIWKKIEKIKFFRFFCQNRFWPLVFDRIFLKFVPKNFKTEFICALEGFWN